MRGLDSRTPVESWTNKLHLVRPAGHGFQWLPASELPGEVLPLAAPGWAFYSSHDAFLSSTAHSPLSGASVSNFNLAHMHRKRCYFFISPQCRFLPSWSRFPLTDWWTEDRWTHTGTKTAEPHRCGSAYKGITPHSSAEGKLCSGTAVTLRMEDSITSALLPTTHGLTPRIQQIHVHLQKSPQLSQFCSWLPKA